MVKITDECVQCPDGRCIGSVCCNLSVKRVYCDNCKNEISSDEEVYFIEGEHYCEECALEQMEDWWNNLLTSEKADVLNILYYKAEEL